MKLLTKHGNATWQDMPYNPAIYTSFPSSTAWKNGIKYKNASYGAIATANLADVKTFLNNGNVGMIWIPIYDSFGYDYPVDTAGSINNGVVFGDTGGLLGSHYITIIG